MWQRFSEAARRVVFSSQEEAQAVGDSNVSTEHLLLGLLRVESTAHTVFANLRVSPDRIRAVVLQKISNGSSRPSREMTLTPRAKRVIDLAYEEARRLGDNFIGTEHLLLGLSAEQDGLAAKALEELGLTLQVLRSEVLNVKVLNKQRAESDLRSEASPPPSAGRVTMAPQLLSTFLVIRQQLALPDLLALAILAERTDEISRRLASLSQTPEAIETAIENEIWAVGSQLVPREVRLSELLDGSQAGTAALFLTIATHASTYTKKALDRLNVSPEELRAAFED